MIFEDLELRASSAFYAMIGLTGSSELIKVLAFNNTFCFYTQSIPLSTADTFIKLYERSFVRLTVRLFVFIRTTDRLFIKKQTNERSFVIVHHTP